MSFRIGLLLFALLEFCCVIAQQDTLPELPQVYNFGEIVVSELKVVVNPLAVKQNWDAQSIAQSASLDVSDFLQKSSSVYVKSFGSGGLATVSLRGTGAGRSATVWNGMPLIGSTLGLLDYSLLNANLFEDVDLTLGGDSGRFGSGSIGGSVFLNNNKVERDHPLLNIKTVFGSFGRYHQGLRYNFSKGKWWSSSRLSYETAKHNFKYQIREDLPVKENTNAARKQLALLQSFGVSPNEKNDISFHIWAQDNAREIPPTTVQTRSEAEVLDKTIRMQGIWKNETSEKISFNTIAAASYNQNEFVDSLTFVFGDNIFKQLYLKSEASIRGRSQQVTLGASNRYTQAITNNYVTNIGQNQLALFGQYQKWLDDWSFYLSLREELIDDTLNPISGTAIIQHLFKNRWHTKLSVNKHFRTPALNDLYWAPGGDAELKPESGWSQELSISFQHSDKWKAGINIYNHNIQNWIQWGLLEERNFFSALNLPEVWSRGIETHLNTKWGREDNLLLVHLSYNYNIATYEFSLRNPVINEGEQIFYTPLHQAVANIAWERPKYRINYTHRYQSGVTSIIDPLDGFHLGSVSASYKLKNIRLFLEVDNLWNANYRVIERRAMPGRNFNIGINLELINKTKI